MSRELNIFVNNLCRKSNLNRIKHKKYSNKKLKEEKSRIKHLKIDKKIVECKKDKRVKKQ